MMVTIEYVACRQGRGPVGRERTKKLETLTLTRYYNQLVAAGRNNTPSFREAAQDLAPQYSYIFLAA